MKNLSPLVALALLAIAGVAYGHADLQKSVPANNSTITQSPKSLNLTFSAAVQLTALTIQKGDGPPEDLGPLPKLVAKEASVKMPAVEAGTYIVKWRAAGEDGHVMSGTVLFNMALAAKPQ